MALTQRQQEIRVGLFVITAIGLMLLFAWIMGVFNPFQQPFTLHVHYGFAGGIQNGSPVRVSGITVGKVSEIRLNPERVDEQGRPTPIELVLNINPKIKNSVRGDSEFYVNLAGLIGEKYLEVTPGTMETEALKTGANIRGVDPPRIDQLLSQSFGLAGDIRDILKDKENSIKDTIRLMLELSDNLNKLFVRVGSQKNITVKKLDRLFNNLVKISSDLRVITDGFDSPEGKRAREILHLILLRLEKIDKRVVRKFLQEEGIKTHIDF